jgi:hypothetical protein
MTYPGKGLKTTMMAFDGFHPVAPGIASVPIHFECHMLWHRALAQSSDEKLSEAIQRPFSRGRLEDQPAQHGNGVRHVGCVGFVSRGRNLGARENVEERERPSNLVGRKPGGKAKTEKIQTKRGENMEGSRIKD